MVLPVAHVCVLTWAGGVSGERWSHEVDKIRSYLVCSFHALCKGANSDLSHIFASLVFLRLFTAGVATTVVDGVMASQTLKLNNNKMLFQASVARCERFGGRLESPCKRGAISSARRLQAGQCFMSLEV